MKQLLILIIILITAGYFGIRQQQEDYGKVQAEYKIYRLANEAKRVEQERQEKRQRQVALLRRTLERYSSPLVDSVDSLLDSDNFNFVNHRIIVGLAFLESTLGKYPCKDDRFNVFGIGACRTNYNFGSYENAIAYTANLIATDRAYRDYRATGQLYDLIKVYCPPKNSKGEFECDTQGYTNKLYKFINDI